MQYWWSNYKYHWNDIPAINPAKRDSPGDHLLVNVCMRTSKMEGGNDGSGQMQWLPPGQNWNDRKVGSPPYWWFPLNSPHVPQNYEIFHMISVILLYYKQILAKFLDLSVWSITCKKPTITCLELAAFCLAFSKVIFDSRKRVFSGGNYMVAQCPD